MEHGKFKKKFQLNKLVALTLPLLITILSHEAYALPKVSGIAHPPYRIKPNTPFAAPSGLSPAMIKTAYGFSSIPFQGAGQTIAIVDAYDNPNAEADLNVFSSAFGLPECTTANGCFTKVFAAGTQPSGDAGWGVEISLDVQWAHAIAPQAKIMLVEAADASFNGLFDAINVAIQHGATVVSMSWGGGEFSEETQVDGIFNVPGVTFTASAGDDGTETLYPAASPFVISVGGTTLDVDASGNYVKETAWSGSGGGISAVEREPAYQSNLPIPKDTRHLRGLPDVSYNADPNSGVSVYDSFGQSGWLVVGGTSAGAPQWAALAAIAKSGAGKSLTDINGILYTIAKQSFNLYYHDITSGTNGSCGYRCTAQIGYDYVTGIGSPRANVLIPQIIKLA